MNAGEGDWHDLLSHAVCGNHIAQLYQDESFLTAAASRFIETGLTQGLGVVVIVTVAHWILFARRLGACGIDPDHYVRTGQLVVLDADCELAGVMTAGVPDRQLFCQAIAPMIERLSARYATVKIFGEIVDIVWQRGERDAAQRLEEHWNTLSRHVPFSLLCVYCADHLSPAVYGGPLESICRTHSHLIPTRDYPRFEAVVAEASQAVLGPSFAQILRSLSTMQRSTTRMPAAQSTLFYLNERMPLAAQAVMEKARLACSSARPGF